MIENDGVCNKINVVRKMTHLVNKVTWLKFMYIHGKISSRKDCFFYLIILYENYWYSSYLEIAMQILKEITVDFQKILAYVYLTNKCLVWE